MNEEQRRIEGELLQIRVMRLLEQYGSLILVLLPNGICLHFFMRSEKFFFKRTNDAE